MAAQKGSALLLKIGADATAAASADTYTTVGGLRSTSITLNQESVDITNKDSSNARELLAAMRALKAFLFLVLAYLQTQHQREHCAQHSVARIFQTLKSSSQTLGRIKASSTSHL